MALLAVAAAVTGSLTMMGPFRDAIEIRERLDERYGPQSAFTPAVDGSVDPDRMERFLAVRSDLMEVCGRLEQAYDSLHTLDRFDGQEDPPKAEILKGAIRAARGAFGLAPAFGDFALARNHALTSHGMGLGEYTYIYSIAYGDRLIDRQQDGEVLQAQVHVSRRLLNLLQEMLRKQLESADPESIWANTLRDEIRRLQGPAPEVPWTEEMPPAIASSLEPYRQELENNYCPHTVKLELSVHRVIAGGIGVTGE